MVDLQDDALQSLSSAMCANIFNKIKHKGIRKECTIIGNAFEQVQQTVDSFGRPNG
jgi:hypothetical protein